MDEWARFQHAWTQLRLKWDVPALHMSRIMAPDREEGWQQVRRRIESTGEKWENWRDHVLLDEFCGLIASASIAAVGCVIDTAAYRSVRDADPKDFVIANADCNVYLFHHVLMSTLDIVERVDKSALLTICIDDDEEHAFYYYKSYWNLQRLAKHPKCPQELMPRFERISQRIDQVAFCKDTFHPALQAADILAYISRRYKTEQAASVRFSDLYATLTRGGTYSIQDYPESVLRRIAAHTARIVQEGNNQKTSDGV